MRVDFYANLRTVAGGKSIYVDIPLPGTVRMALKAATDQRPALAEQIWRSPDQLYDHIRVFLNGRDSIFLPEGLDSTLNEADKLDVFPPVGGGSLM